MAENSISYGMGLSDQMINQMLQSDDASIVAQAQNYINQSQTQQEEKPSLLKRIGNFFISPAASAEVDINSNQNTLSEDQLNYLLQSSYLPSDTGFQIGQFGPNKNYLGKGMQGLESLGVGPNLNYLGDGPRTGSIGVGPNQNYLGKGLQIGSMGQPRYDSGTQTIFPSNMSPALSDLGGITPSYGVANEDDVEQVDSLTGEKKSTGLMDLIMSIALPGSGFLKNIKQDPRATGIRNFYSPEGLTSSGSIASGIMKGYNPVSGGFLNMITGGKYGKPTQYGLAGAMQRRIENILGRKAPQTDASRAKIAELRNLQLAEMTDRYDRGESLSDIGRSTFTGKGMAFEKQSGGVSGKGTANERNYGGR
jgi:hypothetical protein